MQVDIVNHGDVFGTGSWYTFYCPHCSVQVGYEEQMSGKCKCGESVEWGKSSESES